MLAADPHSGDGGGGSSSSGARPPPRYTLAQFQPLEELGAGSFGLVRRVVNTETGEVFAMKIFEKRRVKQRGLEKQLCREVLTQVRVKHANVVRLHYYFEDGARIYCLLEFAERGTLFQHLKALGARGLQERPAVPLFIGTCAGLAYLHSLRVAHRDMKPENILLFGQELCPKIADFGWCVELTDEEPTRRTFCGTLDYLAPEMLKRQPHNTGIDLWALGVLLFEMLLARAPFASASQKETIDLICAARFDIPRDSMSEAAEDLIRKLLVKNASARLPLAQVLRHSWLQQGAAAASPVKGAAAGGILDATVAAPRREGPSVSAQPAGEALDEHTIIVPRRPDGARATAGAAAGAAPSWAGDNTLVVPRRQAPAAFGPVAEEAAADTEHRMDDHTVIVPRRRTEVGEQKASASPEWASACRALPSAAPPQSAPASSPSGAASGGGSTPSCPSPRAPSASDWPRRGGAAVGHEQASGGASFNNRLREDLDGRLLAPPPASGNGGGPAASKGGAIVGGGSVGDGDTDLWLIKDFVVRDIPRPKAKSSRRGSANSARGGGYCVPATS